MKVQVQVLCCSETINQQNLKQPSFLAKILKKSGWNWWRVTDVDDEDYNGVDENDDNEEHLMFYKKEINQPTNNK